MYIAKELYFLPLWAWQSYVSVC